MFRTEGQALSFIRSRIAKGTIVNADEGTSWDALHATLRNEARSTIKRRIASAALARIGRRNFSAGCAAPRLATITTSPGRICSATRKRHHGAKTIAAISNGEQVHMVSGLAMKRGPVCGFLRVLAAALMILLKCWRHGKFGIAIGVSNYFMRQKHGSGKKKDCQTPPLPAFSVDQTRDTPASSQPTKPEQKREFKIMGNTEIAMVWWDRAVGVFTGLLFLVGALQLWDLYETNNFTQESSGRNPSPFCFC